MDLVHQAQLILSIIVAIVLLAVGVTSLIKKNITIANSSDKKVLISEWILVVLGGLLLISSVWAWIVHAEYY